MIKNNIIPIGVNQIDINQIDFISKVEHEISSLDLREDNRKYIKGFVQLNDNSIVDAIFVYTENFYEDIKEICIRYSTNKLIFVPYDLDARCFVDISEQKLYDKQIDESILKYYFTDGNNAVFILKDNEALIKSDYFKSILCYN